MVVVLGNNRRSLLGQTLTSTGSVLTVTDSTVFPTLGAGEYFYLTVVRSDGAFEIVRVTSAVGVSLTVLRAQEGTVAREFPAGSGVEMRVTAASVLDAAQDAVDALTLGDLGITATAAEINILDGATLSTAELNILDGATVTAAELNILDGALLSTAELNILDGATVTAAELNILDGATLSTAELNILDGATVTAAELNILDGATLSTAELNYVDGVTSPIQTQLDAKVPRTSATGSAALPTGTTGQRDVTPAAGYFRFNSTLGVFEGYNGSVWGGVGGATGGGSDRVFYENDQVVTTNYTISDGKNAMSTGPITINAGVTVTVGAGEVWTVI